MKENRLAEKRFEIAACKSPLLIGNLLISEGQPPILTVPFGLHLQRYWLAYAFQLNLVREMHS